MIGTQKQRELDSKVLVDDSRTSAPDCPLLGEEIACDRCGFFFRGDVRAGCPHGDGVLAFKTKGNSSSLDQACLFSGSFRYGRRDGPGHADVCLAKMKLDGCWKNDRLNGPVSIDVSEMEKSNILLFKGDLGDSHSFSMDGPNCVLQWKNGVSYKGGLRRGQRSGEGTMYLFNQPLLKCQWDSDQPQGFAHRFYLYFRITQCSVRRVQDAPSYKALFVGSVSKGRLGPFGRLYDEDNQRKTLFYEGQWVNDLPEGRGMMVLPEGTYEGSFCEGLRNGDGMLKCSVATRDFTISGHWADDQLVQLFSISTRDSAKGNEMLCQEFQPLVTSSKKIAAILETSCGIRKLSPSLLRIYHLYDVVKEELPTASEDLDYLEKEISALRSIWHLNFWDRHVRHTENQWKPGKLELEILRAGGLMKEGRNLCKAFAKRPSSEMNGFKCVCTFRELVRETQTSKSMDKNNIKSIDMVEWNEVVVFPLDVKSKKEALRIQIYAKVAEAEYLLGTTMYSVDLHEVTKQNRSIMAQSHVMGSFLKGCIIGSLFLSLTFS